MAGFIKRLSLVPTGLRYKLMVSFSLMSIIPLLVCVYLVNVFIFPNVENIPQTSLVILLTIIVAFLGLILAKRLVNPIIDMALEAKIIASGDYERKIKADREDEIGQLGGSINTITKQIKNYMDELHSYSLKTKDMNLEIQKKILALSNLLQIGDMIASAEELEHILELVTEKISDNFKESFGALYMTKDASSIFELRASHDIGTRDIKSLKFELGKGYLGRSIGAKIVVSIDSGARVSKELATLQKDFQVKNCLIMPIVVRRRVMGFLVTGNQLDDFSYKEEDIELVKVLTKQIGIALENDLLLRKAEELAFKDDLTGLYNESYIRTRLDEEIHRAILCQRPCSFLKFNIDGFKAYRDVHGEMATEEILKKIANLIKENSTEIGKVARLGGNEFAVVLPEKNKREAYNIAEDIRVKVETLSAKLSGKNEKPLSVSGGVSENPIDGSTAEELIKKATETLAAAKKSGKNKIIA